MPYFEIYIAGWILWTVAWHFTEDKDTGLIMLSGLFWPVIVPIVAVVFPASLLTDYVRSVKRSRAERRINHGR